MKQKLLFTAFFFLSLTITVYSQNKVLKGIVTDAATNAPLSGVNITISGNTTGPSRGTTTDSTGHFSIEVPASVTEIQMSYVNYLSQTISASGSGPLLIKLVAEARGMDEVIVVGYGTQKKKDLTGAVTTVSGRDVAGRQTVQVSEALQGSMAGVTVTRSNSAPGAGATIRIRGITTTGTNAPLVLVDGVPVDNIDNVNPLDVESLSVLKDAASAAIYGSRGAAGVILVTTKRAKNGQAEIEYNYEYGVQKPTALPKFVGVQDYMRYFNEQSTNDGAAAGPYTQAYITTYLDSNRANPNKFFNTDWQAETMKYKVAPRQRHDLVLTVGTGKLKTKASIGYQTIGAFYDNYDYSRYQFRLNNDLQINDKLSANLDIAYKRTSTSDIVPTPGFGNPIYEGRVLPPIYGAYYTDGRFAPGKDGRNPMAQIYEGGFNKTLLNQVVARLAVNFRPVKDLLLTALVSPSFDFDKFKNYARQIKFSASQNPVQVINTNLRPTTNLNEARTERIIMNGQFLANYTKEIAGDHSISVLAGYEENYTYFESVSASREGFSLLGYPYLDAGSRLLRDNSGNASEAALRSFFGRLGYSFRDRYLLQGNLRYDKSSRFGKKYRDAVFPSVSAGWVISEEQFLQNVKWLSFLKARISVGEAGNERIGNYPYQSTLSASTALFYQGTAVVPLTGYAQTDYAVNDISWETTRTTDIGLDMAFLKNRLTVTADYFSKKTSDILLLRDIPNYIGYTDPFDNLGVIGAKGWELEMGWKDRIGQLNYSISANISDAKTKVLEISNTSSLGSIVNIKGQEFNAWYGYQAAGLFQTAAEVAANPALPNTKPGDVKYLDINKDGKISSDGDRVILGGSLPRYQYGGNIRLDYKGIDFSIVFQGVGKRKTQMPSESIQPFAEAFGNMPTAMVGRFWSLNNTPEQNQAARFPRLSRASNTNNYTVSDFYLISGAYFRLKNISIGYTLQPAVFKKAGIKSIRLYGSVNDLFTIDKIPRYIDIDPEAANFGYPIVTTFLGGAIIRF